MNWILVIIGILVGVLDLLWFIDLAVNHQLANNAFPLSIFVVLAIALIHVGKRMD
jgi:hypothetical protein